MRKGECAFPFAATNRFDSNVYSFMLDLNCIPFF